jgi:hypothetical protein
MLIEAISRRAACQHVFLPQGGVVTLNRSLSTLGRHSLTNNALLVKSKPF